MKRAIDPIIAEIHETRRKIAERFGCDAQRISEDAKCRQVLEGRPIWQATSTNKALHPSDGGSISESGQSSPATS